MDQQNTTQDAAAAATDSKSVSVCKESAPQNAAAEVTSKSNTNHIPNPQSKNQQKKRARWEKALANKKRRKEQEREVRQLKAKHDGRDLDKEREEQLQNEQEGKGWERREELWKQKMKDADVENSFRVCFDCSFEDQMTWKETNSLSLQLRYTYAVNRKSSCPVFIDVCSLKKGGETRSHMEKVVGFPERWEGRAFNTYENGLDEVYDCKTNNDADSSEKEADGSKPEESKIIDAADGTFEQSSHEKRIKTKRHLVYLTGDSPNTLSSLDNNTTYIIGGIVDRNRLKRAAINRADALNITTARLPLEENLDFRGSTRVLTCNHVFEILLKYRENGYKDWKDAILSVLPGRKEVQEKNNDGEEEAENS